MAWLVGSLCAATGWRAYAAESTKADEQELSRIEREWADAFKTQDRAFYQKYLSDDFTFIDEDGGFSKGRSAYIDMVMKLPKWTEYTISDETIRVHGKTAVVTGRVSGTDVNKATDVTRYTDTYVKGPDGWKAIASQDTKSK